MPKQREARTGEEQLHRLRRICGTLPGTTEKLSHGEPTFFAHGRVYAMFANNHHNDGHFAVWIPAPPGSQEALTANWPDTYFRPPYVGVKGWVGIELDRISDEDLTSHLLEARRLITAKKTRAPAAASARRRG